MTLYSAEVLRVDASGNLAIVYLTILDDDTNLASQEAGTVYAVDGVALATPPAIDFGTLTGTALDGSPLGIAMTHFNTGGFDYYLLDSNTAPQEFAAVTSGSNAGVVGGFPYLGESVTLDAERLFIGQALQVTFNGANQATALSVTDAIISDDDNRIQFNGLNGAPNSETGVAAQALLGGEVFTGFNTTNAGAGDTQMVLVTLTAQTATGTVIFEALRFTQTIFDGAVVYYMPRLGSVDLATVQAYLGETLLATSANGVAYADFGLGSARLLTNGTALADYLHGTMKHDALFGRNGADSLVGGLGADLLDGGNGVDVLFGGAHRDTLAGGDAGDALFGGIDADRLTGGAGADRLFGGFGGDALTGGSGNDILLGGEAADSLAGNLGADTLAGGAGNDVLDGGLGRDALRGNSGADRFVFTADGVTDRLLDFQNGLDLIDLTEAFATLILTTISAGTVEISHSGETLILTDAAGTLTAADLTAADFV